MKPSFLVQCAGISTALLISGCSYFQGGGIEDPHENFNRSMHSFNDGMDSYISKPLVTGYQWISPYFVEVAIANFFTNLKEPRTVINDVLQGKEKASGEDFERFLLNTFLGFGGLVNVAHYAEIDYHEEDFAQTLAVWGVPRGEYLVLPMLGPASYRSIPGEIVDAASSPVSYVSWPIQLLGLLNSRNNADESLARINEIAVDPYIFMRSAYWQWREHKISEGVVQADDFLLPDLEYDMDLEDEELEVEVGL